MTEFSNLHSAHIQNLQAESTWKDRWF